MQFLTVASSILLALAGSALAAPPSVEFSALASRQANCLYPYRVQEGDTCYLIASKIANGPDPASVVPGLISANGLQAGAGENTCAINVGQSLCLCIDSVFCPAGIIRYFNAPEGQNLPRPI